MNHRFSKTAYLATLMFASVTMVRAKQVEKATNVFRKWIDCQEIYEDCNFKRKAQSFDDNFLLAFKENYENDFSQLKTFNLFLSGLSNNQINENGYQLKPPLDQTMKTRMELLYHLVDGDFESFIECFRLNGFTSQEGNDQETKSPTLDVIEKYKALARLLFTDKNKISEDELLFAVGNRLFEACFGMQTAPIYQSLLANQIDYPIARFINSIIWHHLVGEGWKHWHKNCLIDLKKEADAGKEIVYIAGGSDVFALLKKGIYSIRVIDPFLPTQTRFYSEGWDFLIKGLIGDEIRFGHDCNQITMRRATHQELGRFQTKLSNGTLQELAHTNTTWNIVDKDEQNLGSIILERRLTTQNDFVPHANQVLIMSYDEATYVAMPDSLNGWGIDVTQFDDSFKLFVKQLRAPIGKAELCNLRLAGLLNVANLKFINFGSDPS
jgi:UDP-2,3-diacylglucosamine pyrophosphatase LpxH